MPLVVKTGKYSFLKNLGVSEKIIEALSADGVKFALGSKDFQFISKENAVLAAADLPATALDLSNGEADAKAKEAALVILTEAAKQAVATYAGIKDGGLAKAAKQAVAVSSEPSPKKAGVLRLRDASELYQRVRGTSDKSVYVVVAISPSVKVAARITGSRVSIRVEGALTKEIVSSFSAQGVVFKNNDDGSSYMSGHFECTPAAPAEKVIGAVLFSIGHPFDTPLPEVARVRKLSA